MERRISVRGIVPTGGDAGERACPSAGVPHSVAGIAIRPRRADPPASYSLAVTPR
jgi:hypothetical protein